MGSILLWIALIGYLGWGTYQAHDASTLIAREVIVLEPQTSPSQDEKSKQIPLRRFAGSGSSANTTVQPGESLYLDLDESENPRHTQIIPECFGTSQEVWMARRRDGSGRMNSVRSPRIKSICPDRSFPLPHILP